VSAPVQIALVLLGLIVSAKTRLSGVILGQPVSVPVLGIVAAVLPLALTVLVLVLLRLLLRDGLGLRPRPVTA
jgi:hypothetical protein